jgi:hypothetical protein
MKNFNTFSLVASIFTFAIMGGCADKAGYPPYSTPAPVYTPGISHPSSAETGIEKSLSPENKITTQKSPHKGKPDLADVAEGLYHGDVISDSKGSSQSNVTVTVTRIGKNTVRVNSDYSRLPVVEVPLTQAMGKILNASGSTAFVLDRSKIPVGLDISFLNEVSWSGVKQ